MRAGSVTRMGARTGSTTTRPVPARAPCHHGPPPHAASMTTGTVPTSTMPVDPARCSDDINDSDDPIDEDTDTNREEMRMPPVCKPGSVGTPKYTGWSFLSTCRRRHVPAAYPRLDARRHPVETGRLSPPIWPCSDRGLPCHVRCRTRGGLLLHPSPLPPSREDGGLLSVALSVTRRSRNERPGVTWRSALWSPDFPRNTGVASKARSPVSRPSDR